MGVGKNSKASGYCGRVDESHPTDQIGNPFVLFTDHISDHRSRSNLEALREIEHETVEVVRYGHGANGGHTDHGRHDGEDIVGPPLGAEHYN